MPSPKKYPNELRARSIRLVLDLLREEPELTVTMASRRIGGQLGMNGETLRGWVKWAQIDQGVRPGMSSCQTPAESGPTIGG
jgi:transposase